MGVGDGIEVAVAVGLGVGVRVGVGVGVAQVLILVLQLTPLQQKFLVPQNSILPRKTALHILSAGDLLASGGWQFLNRFACPGTGQASAAGHRLVGLGVGVRGHQLLSGSGRRQRGIVSRQLGLGLQVGTGEGMGVTGVPIQPSEKLSKVAFVASAPLL